MVSRQESDLSVIALLKEWRQETVKHLLQKIQGSKVSLHSGSS